MQDTFGDTRYRKPKDVERHVLSGYLYCSDCGGKLHYKNIKDSNDHFSCGNNRKNKALCPETHHVRADYITQYVVAELNRLFIVLQEQQEYLIDRVLSKEQLHIASEMEKLNKRREELELIFERLVLDRNSLLREQDYLRMNKKYATELSSVLNRITELEEKQNSRDLMKTRLNELVDIANATGKIETLSPDILRTYIDNIIIHHRRREQGEKAPKVKIEFKYIGNLAAILG